MQELVDGTMQIGQFVDGLQLERVSLVIYIESMVRVQEALDGVDGNEMRRYNNVRLPHLRDH